MFLRLTYSRLILSGVLVCAFIVLFLNLLSYQRDDEVDMIDDSHGYVMTDDHGDILIRIKADVKYNHEPAALTVEDKDFEIPKVQIRTYMVTTSHEEVRRTRTHGCIRSFERFTFRNIKSWCVKRAKAIFTFFFCTVKCIRRKRGKKSERCSI